MTLAGKKLLVMAGLAGALALGGCAYDDGYGYGGVSVGTGYYGGGGYYDSPYGYGYGPGYYNGWYDGFYYPGSGYYVYDRGGRRHRWTDGQRRYWEGRHRDRGGWRDRDRDNDGRPDWGDGRGPGRPDRPDRPDRPRWGDGNAAPSRPALPNGQPGWRGSGGARAPEADRPRGGWMTRGLERAGESRSRGGRGRRGN